MSKKGKIMFTVFLLIAALSLGYAVYYFSSKAADSAVYDQLQEYAAMSTPAPVRPEETVSPRETQPYVSPIDWESLWAINEDIYAWIELPGEWLSYPVLQHPYDTNYYLDHTAEGHEGYPGSIYTFPGTEKDFSQFNTVIYGHNMAEGEMMFGNIKRFRNRDYFDRHRILKIYTPDAELTYTLFAVVVYDDRLISVTYDEDWEPDREAFLDSIFNNDAVGTVIMDDVTVDTDDKLVTLSTCIAGQPYNRLLLLGVLTAPEELPKENETQS